MLDEVNNQMLKKQSFKTFDWPKLKTRLLSKLSAYFFWLDIAGLINIKIKINLPTTITQSISNHPHLFRRYIFLNFLCHLYFLFALSTNQLHLHG